MHRHYFATWAAWCLGAIALIPTGGMSFLSALLDGEISILVAFATKIVNNIREVQSGVAIGVGGRQRALVPFDARGALVWVNVAAFLPSPFLKHVMWLRNLFREMGIATFVHKPTVLEGDNKQAGKWGREDMITSGNRFRRRRW